MSLVTCSLSLMKKFTWPLQRLLDVTAQRETAARAAVFALAHAMVALRGRIAVLVSRRRELLDELARDGIERRMARQDFVMASADTLTKQLRALDAELADLAARRKAKMTELMQHRARRKLLENLRERALAQWRNEQNRQEQLQLDEAANIAFTRR